MEEDAIAYWKVRVAKYSSLSDEELEALADLEPFHPKHNPDPDTFLECPDCGEETVVQMAEDPDIGVCTNKKCREVCSINTCLRCGERLTDGSDICEACIAYIDRQ